MIDSSVPCDQALLSALGVKSSHGRLSANARRKLVQVAGLLPWLLGAIRSRQSASPLAVEFGCGKAYLGFFLAQAIRDAGEGPVDILGVDRNAGLVARCRRVRDILGWTEMDFRAETCEAFTAPGPPALVCALHACDVVTDHVIAAGIDMGAEHIIVAPCCHSTSQRKLREAGHRHEWGYAARCFPLLGSRFSEFVTEALRCLALRSYGYEVKVREFAPGTATPKNMVIVASSTGKTSARARRELHRIEEVVGFESEVRRSLRRRRSSVNYGNHAP